MNILKISIVALLIFICSAMSVINSYAADGYSTTHIYDGEMNDLFRYHINDDICFPDKLTNKNEVYVFIFAGGTYQTIKVFGTIGASELHYKIKEAFASTYLKQASFKSREEKYSSVIIKQSTARIGLNESTTIIKVGDIRRHLISAGFKPYIVVKVHSFAELSTKVEPTYSWAGEKWFNPEESKIGDNLSVRVKSSQVSMNIFYLVFILLPVISVIGTAVCAFMVIKSKASLEYRCKLLNTIPMQLPIFVILIQLPLFIFLVIFTDWLLKIADLWFGSFPVNPISSLLILFAMSMLLVIPISMLAKKRIIINNQDVSNLEMVTTEKINKSMLIKSILLLQAVAIIVLIYSLFCYNYATMILASLILFIVKYAVRKNINLDPERLR